MRLTALFFTLGVVSLHTPTPIAAEETVEPVALTAVPDGPRGWARGCATPNAEDAGKCDVCDTTKGFLSAPNEYGYCVCDAVNGYISNGLPKPWEGACICNEGYFWTADKDNEGACKCAVEGWVANAQGVCLPPGLASLSDTTSTYKTGVDCTIDGCQFCSADGLTCVLCDQTKLFKALPLPEGKCEPETDVCNHVWGWTYNEAKDGCVCNAEWNYEQDSNGLCSCKSQQDTWLKMPGQVDEIRTMPMERKSKGTSTGSCDVAYKPVLADECIVQGCTKCVEGNHDICEDLSCDVSVGYIKQWVLANPEGTSGLCRCNNELGMTEDQHGTDCRCNLEWNYHMDPESGICVCDEDRIVHRTKFYCMQPCTSDAMCPQDNERPWETVCDLTTGYCNAPADVPEADNSNEEGADSAADVNDANVDNADVNNADVEETTTEPPVARRLADCAPGTYFEALSVPAQCMPCSFITNGCTVCAADGCQKCDRAKNFNPTPASKVSCKCAEGFEWDVNNAKCKCTGTPEECAALEAATSKLVAKESIDGTTYTVAQPESDDSTPENGGDEETGSTEKDGEETGDKSVDSGAQTATAAGAMGVAAVCVMNMML